MNRLILVVLALAGVLVAAVVPVKAQDLTERVRDAVITAVKEKTGRNLSLKGELSFSMQPSPHMTAKQVVLSNPQGFDATPFITMEQIDISFDLVAALTGNMVINGFVMKKPTINFVVNKAGANNWSFGSDALQTGVFEISNALVMYSDAQKQTSHTFKNVNLKINAPQIEAPLLVIGNLEWDGEKVTLFSSLTTLKQFNEGDTTKIVARLASEQFSIDLTGDISRQKDGFKFANTTLLADDMEASGKGSFRYGKIRPYISADFQLDKLLLTEYLGNTSQKAKAKAGWSKQVFDLSRFKKFDGNFKLSTGSVHYQKITTGAATLVAKLKKGILKVSIARLALYDGTTKLNLSLDGRKPKAVMNVNGSVKSVKALPFLLDAADLRKIEGRATIGFNLNASGSSQMAFMQTLRGTADVNFRDGALLGINIGRILRSVKRGKTSGFAKGGKTKYKKITAKFRFRKGVGRNKKLRMSGGEVRISGGGRVAMANRTLSYRVHPSLVGRGGISVLGINVPIIIAGPWDNPQIYPDLPGFLDTPQIALKGLTTVGKGSVEGVVDVTKKVVTPIGKIITAPFKKLF